MPRRLKGGRGPRKIQGGHGKGICGSQREKISVDWKNTIKKFVKKKRTPPIAGQRNPQQALKG